MKTTITSDLRPAATASTATRDELILSHMPQVRAIAKRVLDRVPRCITFDDVVGAGTLGLIQAVDRFDADRHVRFDSYAKHRIRGAMLDFLREQDPLSRGERCRLKQHEQPAYPVNLSLDDLPPHAAELSVSGKHDQALFRTQLLNRSLSTLSARELLVIQSLFSCDQTSAQAAVSLGICESRVSHLKTRACAKLRVGLLALGVDAT